MNRDQGDEREEDRNENLQLEEERIRQRELDELEKRNVPIRQFTFGFMEEEMAHGPTDWRDWVAEQYR